MSPFLKTYRARVLTVLRSLASRGGLLGRLSAETEALRRTLVDSIGEAPVTSGRSKFLPKTRFEIQGRAPLMSRVSAHRGKVRKLLQTVNRDLLRLSSARLRLIAGVAGVPGRVVTRDETARRRLSDMDLELFDIESRVRAFSNEVIEALFEVENLLSLIERPMRITAAIREKLSNFSEPVPGAPLPEIGARKRKRKKHRVGAASETARSENAEKSQTND